MRLLLEPAATEAAGGAAPPPKPEPSPAPAQAAPAPQAPSRIEVEAAEYAALHQKLAALTVLAEKNEAEKAAAVAAEQQKAFAALAESKGITAALEAQREQLAAEAKAAKEQAIALERDWLGEHKANVIQSAIGAAEFVSDAARQQTLKLVAERFDVARENGKVIVRDRATGQYAGDSIPALLRSEFAHCLKPTTHGGANATHAATASPSTVATTEPPKTLGEAYLMLAAKDQAEGKSLPGYLGGSPIRLPSHIRPASR